MQTLIPRPQTSLQQIPISMLQSYREALPNSISPNWQVYFNLDDPRLALEGPMIRKGLSV